MQGQISYEFYHVQVFELTKEDKIGWKIKIMLVFLNTPVTKKKDGDMDIKNLTNEKPKKTKQATKNDKNKNNNDKNDKNKNKNNKSK